MESILAQLSQAIPRAKSLEELARALPEMLGDARADSKPSTTATVIRPVTNF
jgi:hypothetical protein